MRSSDISRPLGLEVITNAADECRCAFGLHRVADEGANVGMRLGRAETQLVGGPAGEKLIAPGEGTKPHRLLVNKQALEGALALIEQRHGTSPSGQQDQCREGPSGALPR